ncbi:hypothetical protein GCM10011380_03060 [Sphingomonas metalli]|uniref:Uncharacterized protein n=1 Tax=Sphingomonas metalli TaxID=1779358 RepID=A0A916WPA0_9SPHN|nr:hypothetical protein GCM10011380_03060 [Sphingomonas metalli]
MLAGAALGFVACVALFWPGFATYDSVVQYRQVLGGVYDDWHPPVMARLWALLHGVTPGAGPMLLLQLAGWWIGMGLLAAALARSGRRLAALAIGLITLWPPFLGWQAAVLKDGQAVGALAAATGTIGWFRLRGVRLPLTGRLAVAGLIAFALLVRANAVFAVAPLIAGMMPTGTRRTRRMLVAAIVTAGTLVLSPPINHLLLGAAVSGVEKTQPLYDLAGIAVRTGDARTGFTAAEIATLRRRHCVRSYFWDPLGDEGGCAGVTGRLLSQKASYLYASLARAVIAHSLAYAAHRIAHLNATDRLWVPKGWPGAAPPAGSEPNDLGLGQPGRLAAGWQGIAGWLIGGPAGWPILWIVFATVALAATWKAAGEAAGIARALLVSALGLEASFAVISIAADLRYHLWAMIATALALAIAGRGVWTRRATSWLVCSLALVVAVVTAARLSLPSPPAAYADWMRWTGD